MKTLKRKAFICIIVSAAIIFSITLSASAINIESDDFIIPASELKDAEIKIEEENLITITSKTIFSLDDMRANISSVSSNGETLRAADVNTTVLLVHDSKNTESIYRELLTAAEEGSNTRTKGDLVSGLSAHLTVYFTVQTIDDYDWYRLIRIEGGNDKKNKNSNVIGNGFVISDQTVVYGGFGDAWEDEADSRTDTEKLSNKADSFNIQVDKLHPDWPAIADFYSVLGANYTIDIHNARDDKDIELHIENNIIDNTQYPFN